MAAPRRFHSRIDLSLESRGRRTKGWSFAIGPEVAAVRGPAATAGLSTGEEVIVGLELPDEPMPRQVHATVVSVPVKSDESGLAELVLEWRADDDALRGVQDALRQLRHQVLLVDDEVDNLDVMELVLSESYRVLRALNGDEALAALLQHDIAALVTDHRMPGMTGLDLLKRIEAIRPRPQLSRVLVTAYPELDELEEHINIGRIVQFLRKPFRSEQLLEVVHTAVADFAKLSDGDQRERRLRGSVDRLASENAYLRARVEVVQGFDEIVGNSSSLRSALRDLQRIRMTDVTVHIRGETGTGKELVTRAIHNGGPRADGPLLVQNCAGIPETLIMSTLFGHEKGAFTGAERASPGLFREADGGTVVLDEVSELTPTAQASLLRVLQEGEVTPLGASRPTKTDVRIISITHDDLRSEVEAGRFRDDLYYRLVVMEVELPPLRERAGDVPHLADRFVEEASDRHRRNVTGIEPAAMSALESYRWPGNVRELQNEMERAVVLARTGNVTLADLSPRIVATPVEQVPGAPLGVDLSLPYDDAMRRLSRALIEQALDASDGVIARAAEKLMIDASRLSKLRKRLDIQR